MARATITTLDLSIDDAELSDLVEVLGFDQQVNILLIGPGARTAEVLQIIRPHLRKRIARWSPLMYDEIPDLVTGTLVIDDVLACRPWQQLALQAWIESAGQARVVSIASAPLFPKVGAGFLAALYYRLNVVVVELRDNRES